MSRARRSCTRACKYRSCAEHGGGCDYLGMTGKSRLKAVYDILGVERLNAEQLRKEPLLRPKNCPVFEPRPRGFVKQGPKNIALPGTRRREHKRKFDELTARRLHGEGKNDIEIAAALSVCRTTIAVWRQRNGLTANIHMNRLTFSEAEALRLYEAGLSDKKIGQALGVTTQSIYKWRKRRGLPTKQPGRRKT